MICYPTRASGIAGPLEPTCTEFDWQDTLGLPLGGPWDLITTCNWAYNPTVIRVAHISRTVTKTINKVTSPFGSTC